MLLGDFVAIHEQGVSSQFRLAQGKLWSYPKFDNTETKIGSAARSLIIQCLFGDA
jgi:hypothetical protein